MAGEDLMAATEPEPRTFHGENLRRASFRAVDLSGAVMRGIDIDGAEIDSPWLLEGPGSLTVNGVDVAPFVDAELDRRFPGRGLRRAEDPDGLRDAWAALETAWQRVIERAGALPDDGVDASVGGEWSLAQTMRHLVMAIDTWLGKAVLERREPYHPLGLPDDSFATDGNDASVFTGGVAPFAEVVEAFADRMGMVQAFLAAAGADDLTVERRNPHAPEVAETTLSCVRTILEEGWEHLRYATRDLDALQDERPGDTT